jgi:hypothetical protein
VSLPTGSEVQGQRRSEGRGKLQLREAETLNQEQHERSRGHKTDNAQLEVRSRPQHLPLSS